MGGSEVQVYPQLQGEFEAILDSTRPCLKIKPKPKQFLKKKKHQRLASIEPVELPSTTLTSTLVPDPLGLSFLISYIG